jgi:hypothetical protein
VTAPPYGGSGDSVDPITVQFYAPTFDVDPVREYSADLGNPGVDPNVPGAYPVGTTAVDDLDDDVPPSDAEADYQAAQVGFGAWPMGRPVPPPVITDVAATFAVVNEFTYRSPFYNDPALWTGESSEPDW